MSAPTASAAIQTVLSRLGGVRRSARGWEAQCPAHEDSNPSLSVTDGQKRVLLHCHAGCDFDAIVAALGLTRTDLFTAKENGSRPGRSEIVATYDYQDEAGAVLFQVVRMFPKRFRQRKPNGSGGWEWSLKGARRVPYRLPQIIEAMSKDRAIAIVEGEKDADRLAREGVAATTCPGGAGKWRTSYARHFRDVIVIIIPDRDDAGREHARSVGAALNGVAKVIRVLDLPNLPPKGDVSDWLDAGGTVEELRVLAKAAPSWKDWSKANHRQAHQEASAPTPASPTESAAPHKAREGLAGEVGVKLADFRAYMPEAKYIFIPTRELWPASSVDARLPPVWDGANTIKASKWLAREQAVEQMSWAPGQPTLIADRLISHGGWIDRPGVTCFNLYRPPTIEPGDPSKADMWLEHAHRVFPEEADHIVRWLAHRVQRPNEKVNHALVLQGDQGSGKVMFNEGAIPAVGTWNVREVSPDQLMGRFNEYVKSVILRVSEARDLGDTDRYRFYDHSKTIIAAPPFVLRVDEKHIREYSVPNVCGVVLTTNYVDGIYLPADDRRHFVAWTELTKESFTEDYWTRLYRWYAEEDGYRHIAAYLSQVDLSDFNPKAPPPKTAAFWSAVDAGRAPEDAELADVLERLMNPPATTLAEVVGRANSDFGEWLRDRRNARKASHRMAAAGYIPVRNDGTKDGRWKVGGRNQVIYARREMSVRDRMQAAQKLAEGSR